MDKVKRKILEVLFIDIGCGGVESFVQEILELLEPDMSIDCLVPYDCKNEALRKSVEKRGGTLYELNASKKSTKINVYRPMRKFFMDNKDSYDVIHIHATSIEGLLWGAAAADYNKNSTVITHSHSVGMRNYLMPAVYMFRFVASFSMRRHVDYFCACSTHAAAWTYIPSIQQKTHIIHNGINSEQFRFDPARRKMVRQTLNIPSSDFVIGHVGRLSPCKNQEFVIHIFANVLKKRSNSWLVLVGDGKDRERLERLSKEKKIDHKVLFVGKTSVVSDFLMAMDVFVFPSIYEAFGISVVEAQAAGLPVISSDRLPEEVKMTENFRFLPIANNLSEWTEAILSAQYYEREKGLEAVCKAGYDFKYTLEQIHQLYCTPALEKGK